MSLLHRHTSRFLVIWLFFLPLTLWPTAQWFTIPASAVIAFLLLGTPRLCTVSEAAYLWADFRACARLISYSSRFAHRY